MRGSAGSPQARIPARSALGAPEQAARGYQLPVVRYSSIERGGLAAGAHGQDDRGGAGDDVAAGEDALLRGPQRLLVGHAM